MDSFINKDKYDVINHLLNKTILHTESFMSKILYQFDTDSVTNSGII